MADSREAVAHVLRRAGFGPTAAEVDAAERRGLVATVGALTEPSGVDAGATRTPLPTPSQDPADKNRTIGAWWLGRMVAAEHQLAEKMVYFWHGHWATSVQKVRSAALMLRQLETFRTYGHDGAALTRAMTRDPALLLWLDGQKNTRRAPNENLARELLELFVLGVGPYTEDDVQAAARVLTGWTVDRATGEAKLQPKRHDPAPQTVLGRTAKYSTDELADHLTSQPVHAEFIAKRLWFRFASGDPIPDDAKQRIVAAYRPGHDVGRAMAALLTAPDFDRTRGTLVKQPVEWAVGAMRQLGIRPDPELAKKLQSGLSALGQVPLRPPSVGGWPAGAEWLTTSSVQARLRVAGQLAAAAGRPALDALQSSPVDGRPEALARLLVVDSWSGRSRQALREVAGDPRRLIAVGLVTPEYTVM